METTAAVSAALPTTADRETALITAGHAAGSADGLTEAVEVTVLPAVSVGTSAVKVPDRVAGSASSYNSALSASTYQSAPMSEGDCTFKGCWKQGAPVPGIPAIVAATVVTVVAVTNDAAQTD
ncbi:hypothetical protein GVN24_35000 [Rhizobium sp. CRIBSB]|nr:hypothetical protein [Rhizobium sp. CRIBSB]